MTQTRGRPPKGVSQLSTTAIAKAALAEIDAVGLEATSVRAVARRLSVDPKSLYNYVDGKEGLLDAVADYVLASVRVPRRTGVIEDDIAALAHAFRRHALKHPQATSLVLTRQSRSAASLRPVEAALSILVNAGCSPELAIKLLRVFMATMIGVVLRQAEAALTWSAANPADIANRIEVLRASGFPTVSDAAPFVATIDHDEEFEFTLELTIRMITSRIQESRSEQGRSLPPPSPGS